MTTKRLQIMIMSSDRESWYKNMIGKKFNVLKESPEDYIVEVKHSTERVSKKDCTCL